MPTLKRFSLNQKGLVPILIVLIIVVLVGGYFVYQNQPKPTPSPQLTTQPLPTSPQPTSLNNSCLYKGSQPNQEPFRREAVKDEDKNEYYVASGIINIKGQIITFPFTLNDQKLTGVYIKVKPYDEQSQEFYNHYVNGIERGNTINKKDGTELLFRLGILDNNSFTTFANISSSTKNDIEKLLDSGKNTELRLSIPIWAGSGVKPNFSFACSIEKP